MGVRKRLLETPVERVPADLAATVAAFCEPLEAVRAAYVGLVEVTEDFGYPREELEVAFELTNVGERAIGLVAERFLEAMPERIRTGGCNILEAGAVGPWREHARRVFTRSSGTVS